MSNEQNEMLKPVVTDYNSFGAAVWLFNKLAGNLEEKASPADVVNALRNQAYRVREEAQETIDACDAYDAAENEEQDTAAILEILDGVIDTPYTAFGLLQIAGPYLNTQKAATKICQNNLSKFHTTEHAAEETVTSYGFDSENDRYNTYLESVTIEGQDPVYVVKRYSDGKVMKPVGYQSVDLSDCLHEESVDD